MITGLEDFHLAPYFMEDAYRLVTKCQVLARPGPADDSVRIRGADRARTALASRLAAAAPARPASRALA